MRIGYATILRQIKRSARAVAAPAHVRVAGVDDWAWKKGMNYGTMIVDLERRQVIDVLPDRSAASTAEWLKRHPEVEVISRDRAGLYAEGAREGAPQARQVADRFHLLQNFREAIERQLIHPGPWKDSERTLDEAAVEPSSSTLSAPDFHPCSKAPTIDPTTGRRISPLTAAALCVKPRGQMTPRQICIVDALKAASKEFTIMRQLAMRFRGLFRGGSLEKLNVWLWDAFLRHLHHATFCNDAAS
jgi:transposase